MELVFRENYFGDPNLRRQFIESLIALFDLDLGRWNRLGFWDEAYHPFSYICGDRVIASVCAYSMDLIVQGKPTRAAQICSVGTLPEYRKQGLAQKLLSRAVDWARDTHAFVYLFADPDAYRMYQNFGFRFIEEQMPHAAIQGRPPVPGAVQLDMANSSDIALAYRKASERTAVSDTLGVLTPKLLMYRCLYSLRNHAWYIPDLDLVVLYQRTGDTVRVYDIVGNRMPPFADIYPYISAESDRSAEFWFIPDKLNVTVTGYSPIPDNGAHLLGELPLDGTRVIFPFTAQA